MAVLGLGRDEGGGRVVVTVDGGRSAEGRLPWDRVDAAEHRVRRALSREAGLLLPEDDLAASAGEEEAGAELAALLGGPGLEAVRDALARWRGARDVAGRPAWLVVDARDPQWAGLPWELLEGAPAHAGPAAGCRVARWGAPRARGASGRVERVRVQSATPADPVCARAVRGAEAAARAAGLEVESSAAGGPVDVVHLVSHGIAALGEVGIRTEDGTARSSAGAAAAALHDGLAGARLVVLDVCGGADPGALRTPAAAVAALGVDVLAPARPLDADAAAVLHQGMYRSLAQGVPVPEAVAGGRRALRAHASAAPAGRWWLPVLLVGEDPDGLAVVPTSQGTPPAAPPRRPWVAGVLGLGVALVVGVLWAGGGAEPASTPVPAPAEPAPAPVALAQAAHPAPVEPPPEPVAQPTASPARPSAPRAAAPAAPGRLEVRPLRPVQVRVGGRGWQVASRVMPVVLELPAGAERLEVGEEGEVAFTCEVAVPEGGTVRACPDPVLAGCRCP
ncbi:MAG: CHAT domain-containing protein [Alphaproteobacteria bacterium]|nr:CHAT domain-containing protein [Alphaproteobacteria bacterium]